MENPDYVQFSSYWNDVIVTGLLPLILLCYMNLRVFVKIKVSINSLFYSTGSPPIMQFFETLTKPCKQKTVLLDE